MHPLQQRVSQVRRWWNRRTALELLCWLVAAVVAIAVAIGVVDFLVRPVDRGLRILLSVVLIAALLTVSARLLRWWRRQRWTEMATAQAIQRTFPQLGDRLASGLEFLQQDEDDASAGSAPMRRAVVAETASELETLPAEQVALRPGVGRATAAAAVALILTILLVVLAPSSTRTAISRLVAPWNGAEWPRRNDLEFVEPPKLLAVGETFEVSLVDSSGELPADVAIEYRYQVEDRDRTEQSWMQRVGDTMVARRENVRRPFEYRATGGDHRTMPWAKVDVVQRPKAIDFQLVVHPPSYSGLPRGVATRNSQVLTGSSLEVSGVASQPLSEARLQWSDARDEGMRVGVRDATRLELPAGEWTLPSAESSYVIRCKLVMQSTTGLEGVSQAPPLEVVNDAPPEVVWNSPSGDWSVLAGAKIPVVVTATDDLAITNIEFIVKQAAASSSEGDESNLTKVRLYEGAAEPPSRDRLPAPGEQLDRQPVEYTFNLAPLELSSGAVLQLSATATDYLPQTGTSSSTPRMTIITRAEFDSQLAAQQAALLRQLEQALADQRAARTAVSRVADGVATWRDALDQLLAARLTQQAVRRTLSDEQTGAMQMTQELIEQLAINQVAEPELLAQLKEIASVLTSLDAGPLPAAEQYLTDLRKQFDALAGQPPDEALEGGFTKIDNEQQVIIAALEQLIDRASAWSDADRFIRELVRLEQEQRTLREQSLYAVRRNIESRTNRKVDPVEPDELQRMADAQADVARRFDKLMQSMRAMAASDAVSSGFAARMTDAIQAAELKALSAQLANAAQEVANNQLGRGADTQQQAADSLADMVDRLRDRAPTDPGELASRLRALQQRLSELKQQAEQAASQADPSEQAESQSGLQRELNDAARELSRLSAQAASASTQRAASNASPKPNQSQQEKKENLDQAQQDIEQAERELAQRIAELESEQQQRLLDRLAEVLDDLIPRQQANLEQTLRLELVREADGALGKDEELAATKLAELEAELAKELDEAIADVESRSVFQLALGGAAGDMRQAASSLERYDTGRLTQNLELTALSRMRHVLDILRDPPPPPPEGSESPGGGGGGNQPQRPPLIELAEVKMLRWLQLDLNGRTRLYEADSADNVSQAAEKRAAAQRLAGEQRKLEELVRDMMRRNNNSVQRPVDL